MFQAVHDEEEQTMLDKVCNRQLRYTQKLEEGSKLGK